MSKWEYEKTGKGINTKFVVLEEHGDYREIICTAGSEFRAKRICLTHNSHDGLLEALKEIDNIIPIGSVNRINFSKMGEMLAEINTVTQRAIAAAESE